MHKCLRTFLAAPIVTLAAALLLCAPLAHAQAAAARRTFEVASVKPAPMDVMIKAFQSGHMPRLGLTIDHDRAEYHFMPLRELIANAYGIKSYQVQGPDWLGSDRYDIMAKMPEGATESDAPAMLKSLLEDRFKLVAHRSSEERPVLALVVGKSGPKLKEATLPATPLDLTAPLKPGQMKIDMGDGPAIMSIGAGGAITVNMGERGTFSQTPDMQAMVMHMKGENLTMDGFADMLNRVSQIGPGGASKNTKQVVNKTDLPGHYQVSLDLSMAELLAMAGANGQLPGAAPAMGDASDPGSSGASIAASVQALGLKLEPRKAELDQLIVDKIEKTPTED